ncbi:MAG: hypothetical protein IJU23_14775 [Proteobacteria bacterium]|nr:hypothetical protein [Pseudomonadota bacterium]
MAALGTFSSIASVVLGRTLSDAVLLSARPAVNVANFFIFSSLALMVVSVVYFQLIRIVSATKLNVSMLLLSAFGVIFFQNLNLESQTAILAYATFLITAPALGNIIVWNAIGDAFNARQGRRLFHLVSAASTLGGIAAGCLIPGLVHWFGIAALPVADVSSFILMAVPVAVLRHYRRSEKTQYSVNSESKRSLKEDFVYAVKDIVGSPLLKNLSLIFFLTAVATNIIDFVLKYYLQVNFDKEGIAIFYGHFNAVSNTFNLLVQLTLLSQFLTRFKTRTLFAVTPIILLVFSAPFIFVYSAICVVALRFMDVALRFTIQDSAREIAISSLPRLLRNRSKVVFKGVMNPLGGICTGLLLNILAPILGAQYTPLLLIPVNLAMLYFVRDLNRYSAYHLYKQLKTGVLGVDEKDAVNILTSEEKGDDKKAITYDPEMLHDNSPFAREATLDAILLDNSQDLNTHSVVQKNVLDLIGHEARLAQAVLVIMQAIEEQETEDSHRELDDVMQSFYDGTISRMFKGMMALYRRDMIQTIYLSMANSKASVRAQAMELLQLTLTNCPHAKRILVLCDDFSHNEKVIRLDDIEHIPVDDAISMVEAESDRSLSKVMPKLLTLLPGLEMIRD